MAGYRFYPLADIAQDRIWRETLSKWGETQAEAYIVGLHQHLQRLCENRVLWRNLPRSLVVPADLDMQVWFSRYQHHYVVFRQLSAGRIGVISILHERMDLPVRLTDALLSISLKEKD
jgi:toxin ParE1/3/4